MDSAKQSAGKTLLHPLANGREDIFLVLVALLALLHLAPQVGPRIEPIVVVGVVQVVRLVRQGAQSILKQTHLLTRLHGTQHDAHQFDTAQYLAGSGRGAA
ncbi:hypothetical protein D9M72_611230 [compost metagenome]